jgi:quinol monooxygenase YgiN
MSGYFTMTPTIVDNDARNHNDAGCSVSITFEAGHEDHRDRRSFRVVVTLDDKEAASFHLPYEHAQRFLRALAADMRADLRKLAEAGEESDDET